MPKRTFETTDLPDVEGDRAQIYEGDDPETDDEQAKTVDVVPGTPVPTLEVLLEDRMAVLENEVTDISVRTTETYEELAAQVKAIRQDVGHHLDTIIGQMLAIRELEDQLRKTRASFTFVFCALVVSYLVGIL